MLLACICIFVHVYMHICVCIHAYTRICGYTISPACANKSEGVEVYIRHRALEERKGTKCMSNAQWSWSGRGFELFIGTTTPPDWAFPGRAVLFISFVFLTWHGFFSGLGGNFTPNLALRSTKHQSKSHPKSITTSILFSIAFWIIV